MDKKQDETKSKITLTLLSNFARKIFGIYNPGSYIEKEESRLSGFFRKLVEYLTGVTIARQAINRQKPRLVEAMNGDVIDIGGYDSYFREKYRRGRFYNLDLSAGPHIDIVADAENMENVSSESLGGVFCISVLEHTPHPDLVIQEIYRCLKPGGIAFISSPWMFETHLEPVDFHRFSKYSNEQNLSMFDLIQVDFTNSYYGLIAHVMQHKLLLRYSIGILFFIVDAFCRDDPRWATQISYTLKKPS